MPIPERFRSEYRTHYKGLYKCPIYTCTYLQAARHGQPWNYKYIYNGYYYLRQGGYVFVVVCLSVCLLATLRKTSGKVGNNGPMNKWLNFVGDPDHRLDTGIVFRICHYWEIRKVVNGHSFILIRQVAALVRRAPWRRFAMSMSMSIVDLYSA